MKTSTLLLATLVTVVPAAHAAPELYAACDSSTRLRNVPEHVRYHFNRDCTEVYVLPPDMAEGRIQADAKPASDLPATCDRIKANLQEQNESLKETNQAIRRAADDLSSEGVEKLRVQFESNHKLIQEKTDELQAIAGRTGSVVHFTLTSGQAEAVAKIREANPDLSVQAMPLVRSFVSIIEVRREDVDPKQLAAVLETHFADGGPNVSPGTRAFYEGIGVRVVLSPMGACGTGYDHHLLANLTYTYAIEVNGKLEERVGTSGMY